MKKLYRKGTVYPSPPPTISDHLALLPAAILTLAAALSAEDKEVLAYLISCSDNSTFKTNYKSTPQKSNTTALNGTVFHHASSFNCNCFGCYMSYWVRWDSSPNRQLIHEILDAYEDELLNKKNNKIKTKKDRKKNNNNNKAAAAATVNVNVITTTSATAVKIRDLETESSSELGTESESVEKTIGEEKGSVRSFLSFVGERIWGVWNL